MVGNSRPITTSSVFVRNPCATQGPHESINRNNPTLWSSLKITPNLLTSTPELSRDFALYDSDRNSNNPNPNLHHITFVGSTETFHFFERFSSFESTLDGSWRHRPPTLILSTICQKPFMSLSGRSSTGICESHFLFFGTTQPGYTKLKINTPSWMNLATKKFTKRFSFQFPHASTHQRIHFSKTELFICSTASKNECFFPE